MNTAGDFNIWFGLLSLLPLLVYIVLVLRKDAQPIPVTIICILVGMIVTGTSPIGLGASLVKSLGSFLAIIGLIIMMGRGLGEVMTATNVSQTLVHTIVYGIGVNTKKRAMIGISMATFVLIALLGTMAGGEAILAPIVIPIATSVGLSKSTVATIFDTMGGEALIIGPFAPVVVILMGFTSLSYATLLFCVCLPFVLVTMVITWFNLQKIQKNTESSGKYDDKNKAEAFQPTKQSKKTTFIFMILFMAAIVYGFMKSAGFSFIVTLLLVLSLVMGLAGGLNYKDTCKLFVKGMAGNVNMFFLFILLDTFLRFIEVGGGFKAITVLMQPIASLGGKAGLVLSSGLIGAFGISGAAVAQLKVLDSMFSEIIKQANVSMIAWAAVLIVGSRVTDYLYPGVNMFGAVGFAQSDDIKSVLRNGWCVAAGHCILLLFYATVIA